MPDTWEQAHGLDGRNASDGAKVARNGYTNLENYLNELAGDPIP
jgi:pectate lyase